MLVALNADMYDAAANAGRNAADWWAQDNIGGRVTGDVRTTAARILTGLHDLDPLILDTLPSLNLPERWAANPTARDLYRDVVGDIGHDWADLHDCERDTALNAYRDGYDITVHDEITTRCRAVLDNE